MDARAFGIEHVQRDEQEHDAAGHLERRERDAEVVENPPARHREGEQQCRTHGAGQARHLHPFGG